MGLMPLEYKDCITDSPYFRQKLHSHEKELDRTSQAIKVLTKEVKDLINAAKELSKAHRKLSNTLSGFKFECIGNSQTDDEIVIGSSLKEFAKIVDMVEDERERMLERSYEQIILPLENFRKEAIGGAKEGRKKFEKQTTKFYQNQEKYLNLSTKKDDLTLQEADASVEMEQRYFAQASLEYVFLLQEVQERKKFEFVETLLSYMYSWLTFYHQGHEVYTDCSPYLKDLQVRVQRTRENFMSTRQEAVQLKNKMLEKNSDPGSMDKMYTRQGYLFLMEKKAFGTTWTKHYCQYQKESKIFTMIPYNQIHQKITSTETLMLKTCVRRMSETIDKRFCFDLTAQDRDKVGLVYTLQALCEEDRKQWMDAMDGKEPLYTQALPGVPRPVTLQPQQEHTVLDAAGLAFITRAIGSLENRGLEDQGLYRLVGVSSKVAKLLSIGLDPTKCSKLSLEDPSEWETKTITSAVKQYFRNLPVPLMTYELHNSFIAAAKQDRLAQRLSTIQELLQRLPHDNRVVLKELAFHLCKVASKSDKNLMTVSNLGVCFGPTLLRPEEETVAAIMDIKFCNIVVEIIIEHYDKMFNCSSSELPSLMDAMNLSHPSTPSSSSPKSSPPPSSITSHNKHRKHSQPLLQTVVTSFTTSEPQTVHFGNSSALTTISNSGKAYQYNNPGNQQHNLPSQIWANTNSNSSLNLGIMPGLTSHSSLNSLTSQQASNNQPSRTARHQQQPYITRTDRSMEGPVSTSSSSESLCSRSSREQNTHHHYQYSHPPKPPPHHQPPSGSGLSSYHQKQQHSSSSSNSSPPTAIETRLLSMEAMSCSMPPTLLSSKLNGGGDSDSTSPRGREKQNSHTTKSGRARLGTTYPPTYRQHMETNSLSGSGPLSSLPPTINNNTSNSAATYQPHGRVVRTLYACVGENDSELSFEPNVYLTNVRPSREPGWLEGTLHGKAGLVPENYIEDVDEKNIPPHLLHIAPNTDV